MKFLFTSASSLPGRVAVLVLSSSNLVPSFLLEIGGKTIDLICKILCMYVLILCMSGWLLAVLNDVFLLHNLKHKLEKHWTLVIKAPREMQIYRYLGKKG